MSGLRTVAIVGGGFSGTVLAIQLARFPKVRVVLIERRRAFARGLAYSTQSDRHLLNVRTGRMSAFPDRPDDLVRWLEKAGHPADPYGFTPRKLYGEYLGARLDEAERAAGGRLRRVHGEAVKVETAPDCAEVRLASGETVEADVLVLALGNPPPGELRAFADLPPGRYVADPWALEALSGISETGAVLLVGTGLTMIDVVLALGERGWRGRALALSRRGLLPRPHPARPLPDTRPWQPSEMYLSERLRAFRRRAETDGWDTVMDALRPFNQALWREGSDAERRSFLRHLRPWWDVHRHRTAPQIGAAVQNLIRAARLQVAAGRIERAQESDGGVTVVWRARGEAQSRTSRVERVVNCTGPLSDLARSPDPLVRNLLSRGLARADSYRLGLEVDEGLRVTDAQGRPNPRLYALGPLTRGALWEINAVPEVRVQAAALAERLG